jgi:hypothetical protein
MVKTASLGKNISVSNITLSSLNQISDMGWNIQRQTSKLRRRLKCWKNRIDSRDPGAGHIWLGPCMLKVHGVVWTWGWEVWTGLRDTDRHNKQHWIREGYCFRLRQAYCNRLIMVRLLAVFSVSILLKPRKCLLLTFPS